MPIRLAPNEEPLPGYRLLDRLGRGGFGEVWKAEAPGGLHKAIKFVFGDLESQDEDGRPAEQELKALNRVKAIRHPYILSIERYDIIDGQLLIVMELADRNMWDLFKYYRDSRKQGIPREELLRYLEEAAEALDLMNDRYHIQHLDVKPQNLFVVSNHVKVADFGLAKDFEGVRGTITGGVTPVYAGPETFEGYVSRFTDQYSLAIVYQELLTGTRPFSGANTKQLVMQHLNGVPDLDSLPPADRPIIARSLEKKPELRWPNCTELVRSLRNATVAQPAAVTAKGGSGIVRPPANRQEVSYSANTLAPVTPLPAAQNSTVATSPIQGKNDSRFITGDRSKDGSQTPKPTNLPPMIAPGGSSVLATPRPFVTPRLVTPQAAAAASSISSMPLPALTLQRPQIVQTARMSSLGLAAPEKTGDGVVQPAIIVGIGQMGLLTIRSLKRILQTEYGNDPLPHIRFLYIDTDAEVTASATDTNRPDVMPTHEVVLARLHRQAHYLQGGGGTSCDTWLPPGTLFKLPRTPNSAEGVRALGRLALSDNYRTIAQRVRQEVETFVQDDAVDLATKRMKQEIRSNRARAYIVAGLAGGTGGGMFLDLAYLVRNELRQIGYSNPECIGMLFVTPCDATAVRGTALANTYAALTELGHFMNGRNRYTAKFDSAEPAINDGDPPFCRNALVQLPRRQGKERQATIGLAARSIFLDLCTHVGRTQDNIRREALLFQKTGGPFVQPFGLYRLSWPRADLLSAGVRRFIQRIIQRWTGKATSHLHEPIKNWLETEWTSRGFELELLVSKFDAMIEEHLHEKPEAVFDAYVDPLIRSSASRIEPEAAVAVLEQLLKLIGKPEGENSIPGVLQTVLSEKCKKLASEAESQISVLTVSVIEHPQYRLPGADEALALLEDKIKRTIEALDGIRAEMAMDVRDTYCRLFPAIGGLGGGLSTLGSRKATLNEAIELLRQYPRKRLRLLVLDSTLTLYRSLLTATPECQRDVNMCRSKLNEIAQDILDSEQDLGVSGGPGRMLLPHGIEGIEGAADAFISALPAQEIVTFDQLIQYAVKTKYKRLTDVCLKPEHYTSFRNLLITQAKEFLDSRLERSDPAAVFFRHRTDQNSQLKTLVQSFEESAPDLTSVSGKTQVEATFLAAPDSEDGAKLNQALCQAIPGLQLFQVPLNEEIVLLREYPLMPLAELPQLNGAAKEAYETLVGTTENPHTRSDIAWSSVHGS